MALSTDSELLEAFGWRQCPVKDPMMDSQPFQAKPVKYWTRDGKRAFPHPLAIWICVYNPKCLEGMY